MVLWLIHALNIGIFYHNFLLNFIIFIFLLYAKKFCAIINIWLEYVY